MASLPILYMKKGGEVGVFSFKKGRELPEKRAPEELQGRCWGVALFWVDFSQRGFYWGYAWVGVVFFEGVFT